MSAKIEIHSTIGSGPHYNVVGKLQSHVCPDKSTSDLNISAAVMEPGGSDQEVFRDPIWADINYHRWCPGLTSNISDATPVESSTMLVSYPLLYSDKWSMGNPGWIHTSYDNSTSTQTLKWAEPNNLEDHKVAAFSIMRISSSSQGAVSPLFLVGVGSRSGSGCCSGHCRMHS